MYAVLAIDACVLFAFIHYVTFLVLYHCAHWYDAALGAVHHLCLYFHHFVVLGGDVERMASEVDAWVCGYDGDIAEESATCIPT